MAFIFNTKKEIKVGFDPNKPIFIDSMSCANYTGTTLPFEEVDVSRMTDLSLFFADCLNLQSTPIINLNGKLGLDKIFKGCTSINRINCEPRLTSSFTIYRNFEGNESACFEFALNLLNYTIEETPQAYIYVNGFTLTPDMKIKKIDNMYIADEQGTAIALVFASLGWGVRGFIE